jgi:hypothetical protein
MHKIHQLVRNEGKTKETKPERCFAWGDDNVLRFRIMLNVTPHLS